MPLENLSYYRKFYATKKKKKKSYYRKFNINLEYVSNIIVTLIYTYKTYIKKNLERNRNP